MKPQEFVNWFKGFIVDDDSLPNKREWEAIVGLLNSVVSEQQTPSPSLGDLPEEDKDKFDTALEEAIKELRLKEYVSPYRPYQDLLFSPYKRYDEHNRFIYDPWQVFYTTSSGVNKGGQFETIP